MPDLIQIAIICKEYGYTEEEYWNLSEDFTDAIIARRRVEAKIREDQDKEMESKINKP